MGDLDTARAHFLRALGMAERFGDRTGIALSLDNLAEIEISRGRPTRGMQLAGAAEAIKDEVGGQAPPELIDLPDPRKRASPVLSDEEIDAAWKEGRAMTLQEAIAFAREDG
jgi:hypothetical protein